MSMLGLSPPRHAAEEEEDYPCTNPAKILSSHGVTFTRTIPHLGKYRVKLRRYLIGQVMVILLSGWQTYIGST